MTDADPRRTSPLDQSERRVVAQAMRVGAALTLLVLVARLGMGAGFGVDTVVLVGAATALVGMAHGFLHGRVSAAQVGVVGFVLVIVEAAHRMVTTPGVTAGEVANTSSITALLVALAFLAFPRWLARAVSAVLLTAWLGIAWAIAMPAHDVVAVFGNLFMVGLLLDIMVRVRARHESAARRGQQLAARDELTGLCNRRGALDELGRLGPGDGLVVVDLDRFKAVNDERGHLAGDEVLTTVGAVLAASVRDDDLPVRWGGEEFLIVLSTVASTAHASQMCERVRRAVERADLGVTASVGAAVLRVDEGWEQALARADDALYRAKSAGRNRSMLAS